MIEITSRLPSDYQEVEYLESTGTQYIDTGVKGKSGLVASGSIMLTASQSCIALGCYGSQRCYMLNFNSMVPRYGYVDWYTATIAVTVNEKYDFEVSFVESAQYMKLNGTTVISSANATTFTNSYNMFAFAYNDGGSAGDFAKCRFYALNIYDNGTLIREFVPCYRKADKVAGFYDFLNGVFYTNKGTGSFVVGTDVGGTVITEGGVIPQKYALRRRTMIDRGESFPAVGTPFDNWTWKQIIALANSGADPRVYFAVGDEKNLVLTTGEVVPVVIGDFYHSIITGTSTKAPLALSLKNCLATQGQVYSGSYTNGWANALMNTTTLPSILEAFPDELKAEGGIKYVQVAAATGASTSLTTVSNRLRAPSLLELGLYYQSGSQEGSTYAYYASGNRVKTRNGTASRYLTRSTHTRYNDRIITIGAAGGVESDQYPNVSAGVTFLFDI